MNPVMPGALLAALWGEEPPRDLRQGVCVPGVKLDGVDWPRDVWTGLDGDGVHRSKADTRVAETLCRESCPVLELCAATAARGRMRWSPGVVVAGWTSPGRSAVGKCSRSGGSGCNWLATVWTGKTNWRVEWCIRFGVDRSSCFRERRAGRPCVRTGE